jgi:hypothetical protein
MEILQTQNPKARMAMLGAFLLLPFLGLGIWYWATRTSDTDDQLRRIVEKYGYRAVTPPSRLYGPGIFTTVETLPNGTITLHPTCTMEDDKLAAKWSKSPTVDESLFSAIEQTFAASAKVLDVIESNTTGKRVKGFDFALRNIYVVTLSDEGLRGVRRQYLKDACEEVVIGNLRAGAAVCQSEEVLEADLVYKTNVENELGGGVKGGIAGRATGSVASDQQAKTRYEVRGDDLFLGARVGQRHCLGLMDNGQIAESGRPLAGGGL